MKYGDFSSLVQLGAGIHIGTAVLQLYGELGVEPLIRSLGRTRGLFLAPEGERPSRAIEEELERLESQYEIFKIQLFQEYRKFVYINSGVTVLLSLILAALAYLADVPITENWEWTTIFMAALSLAPAPITLGVLAYEANQRVKPMRKAADDLERRALASL